MFSQKELHLKPNLIYYLGALSHSRSQYCKHHILYVGPALGRLKAMGVMLICADGPFGARFHD